MERERKPIRLNGDKLTLHAVTREGDRVKLYYRKFRDKHGKIRRVLYGPLEVARKG